MLPDAEARILIERAKGGDTAAFDRLIAIHRRRIEALIGARLGPRLEREADPEDIIQETLLKALESIDRFTWQGEDSFMRWVGTIAENVIRTAARKGRRHPEVPLAGDVPFTEISGSRALLRDERFDRFQRAFDALDPASRSVIYLARIEGLPVKEVARRIGRTPNATSILLYRALIKLRSEFGDTESLGLSMRRLEDGKGRGSR